MDNSGGGQDGSRGLRDRNYYVQSTHQGYIVQHRELEPLFCNIFKWSIIYKNTESLGSTPETNIIL